jgi:hypothetical protein
MGTFINKEAVDAYINERLIWSFAFKNKTSFGIQRYYRCNQVKRHKTSARVIMLLTEDDEHVHLNISKVGIKDEKLKKRMNELYKMGVHKPKKMIEMLEASN